VTEFYDTTEKLAKARVKEDRDRKSNPKTVRRNLKICDLRKQDAGKWTLGRLAKEYGITRQTVVRILNQEAKWRRLAAKV